MYFNLKESIINFKYLKVLFFISIILLFTKTLAEYNGNKIYYIIFSIIFNITIIKSLFRKLNFYEFYFGFFIWIGFWVKFSLFESRFYRNGQIFDGGFFCNFNSNDFDEILIISSIGGLGFVFSILLFNLLKKYFNFRKINSPKIIKEKTVYYLLIIFIFFYSVIVIINFYNGYYQKGLTSDLNNHFLTNMIYPYLYNIGFGAAVTFFIFNLTSIKLKNFILIIFLIMVEGFFSNFTLLSRNMILYSTSIFLGYIVFLHKKNFLFYFKYKLIISYAIILIISFTSLIFINHQRSLAYKINDKNQINFNNEDRIDREVCFNIDKKKYNKYIELFLTRSIGIEGVMYTNMRSDILSFDLLKQTIKEPNIKNYNYYESLFLDKGNDKLEKYKNSNQVILPGIMGYLNFSGSKIFLFISMFLISITFLIFEKIIIFFTNNYVLCSFLIFCSVWRLVNFGYLVNNTTNFILSLLITVFILFLTQSFMGSNEVRK